MEKIQVDPATKCWNWTGTKAHGYGMTWRGGRHISAHRAAYEALRGPIPLGRECDHLCHNKGCANPNHIELVTHAENMLRAELRADHTHCENGHPYDAGTPRRRDRGTRMCKQCKAAAGARYHAKHGWRPGPHYYARKAARAALAHARAALPREGGGG